MPRTGAASTGIPADDTVPRSVLGLLRATGHDVTSASELGIGAPDTRWLTLAESEERLILTSDKDFGELVFRDRLTTFGINLLRLDDVAVPAWVTVFRKSGAWSRPTRPAASSWSHPIACAFAD